MLLVSDLALGLSCFLLVSSSILLSLDTGLGSLKALGFDQFSVTLFLVSFLLSLHDSHLFFFEYLHAGLLQCLEAKHIKHRFNLSIEVEKFSISIKYLRCLAVLFCGHLGLKQGHRRPVQVELSRNADLLSRWLVCQHFDVFISLDEQVLATMNWLRGRYVTVGVDRDDTLGSLEKVRGLALSRVVHLP